MKRDKVRLQVIISIPCDGGTGKDTPDPITFTSRRHGGLRRIHQSHVRVDEPTVQGVPGRAAFAAQVRL